MKVLKGILILLAIVVGFTVIVAAEENQMKQEFIKKDSFMLSEVQPDTMDIIMNVGHSFGWKLAVFHRDTGTIIFTDTGSTQSENFYLYISVRKLNIEIGIWTRDIKYLGRLENFKNTLLKRFNRGMNIP